MKPDIYFNGRAGSGKDTQAAYLIHKYGYTRLALADPLKQMACDMLHLHMSELEARKKNYRSFLIALGNGARQKSMWWVGCKWLPRFARLFFFKRWLKRFDHPIDTGMTDYEFDVWSEGWGDPMYWLNRFKGAYDHHKHLYPDSPVVVTDVRYPNEGRLMQTWGLTGIRLDVPLPELKSRLFARDGTTDFAFLTESDSERLWDQVPADFTVDGSLDKDEVHKQVLALVLHIEHDRMFQRRLWGEDVV